MMGKASNGFNSITDGCESPLNKMFSRCAKGPGIHRLANRYGLFLVPLGCKYSEYTPHSSDHLNPQNLWSYDPQKDGLVYQDQFYNLEEAKKRIGQLYKQHVLYFFQYCCHAKREAHDEHENTPPKIP